MKSLLLKMIPVVCLGSLLTQQINSTNQTYNGYENFELKGSDYERLKYGSHYWTSSNLREWLNSSDTTVCYTGNTPSSGNVKNNPYDTEAGFLSHFTEAEREMIAVTTRANVLSSVDKTANTNGLSGYTHYNHSSTISIHFDFPDALNKWNQLASIEVNEKVFLLNLKELTEYVQNRGWEIQKTPSTFVSNQYGYNSKTQLAYFINHPVSDSGKEYLEVVAPNMFKTNSYAYESQGIAPALHLKKEATVYRVKSYQPTLHTWKTTNDSIRAEDLNIGDIVEFGRFQNENIQWRVINITEEGYPLLFSEKVLDIKAFDAKGDYSQRFSYLDVENVFPDADVSTTTFQIQNVQGSTDLTAPSLTLLNEDKLFEQVENQFRLDIQVSDESGIDYILFPDGTKQNINKTNYSFTYDVYKNDCYTFGLMDLKGNFKYFTIPIGNIALPAEIDLKSSFPDWTNEDVQISISTSNNVGFETNELLQSERNSYNGYWKTSSSYAQKQIRISGEVEYVFDKNGFDAANFTYGPGLKYKITKKVGDEFQLTTTWPTAWKENLETLKQRKLNGEGPLSFDTIMTIPGNYYGELTAANWVFANSGDAGNFQIKWSNLKFELLDNDDLAISKITLPSGKIIQQSSYIDTISTEGELVQTYAVTTSTGETSTKSITTRIDKTKPSLKVTTISSDPTTNTITLTLSLSDGLSGLERLETPERTFSLNGDKEKELTLSLTTTDTIQLKLYDVAGNVTEKTITVPTLNLNAQAKPSDNLIRLDWTNINESTYQVYQKKEGSEEFESIGRSLEPVKVLNVYPSNGNSVSFTTWDGENVTLSEGGLLKKWMEEPNAEHAKGYGQGLIKVTPVDFSSFNQNPSAYLKQTNDGKWNYDVVMVGSWDCNGDCANNNNTYFSSTANQLVNEYIQDGYGLLIGHDFRSFTNKVETEGIPAVEPVGSDLIKITKKGILTNFPWNLGEVGTILNIPYAHNAGRYVEPFNIWMQFEGNNDLNHCSFGNTLWCRPDKFWHTSTNNHYLSIKNNVAMIQTGHSSGKATSDEQKVLANTLFFLKQISEQNFLNDYSGQDVKGPKTPSIKQTNALSNGSIELTFNSFVDQGSTYEYYVTATPKDGSSTLASNIANETITTGVAGVSYVIDTNPETEPDNQIDALSNNKLTVQPNHEKTTYLHLKVIDQAGNASETLHYSISIPKINTAEQRDDHIYVNWDIEIPQSSVFFETDFENLDLDLPNGNLINGINLSSFNGPYRDPYGNPRENNDSVRNSLKIISGVGVNASKGIIGSSTIPNGGWDYHITTKPAEENVSNRSSFFFDWQRLKTGYPAVVRFDVKGDGKVIIELAPGWWTGGSAPHKSITYAEDLTAEQFRDRLINKIPIKINNPTGITTSLEVATAIDTLYQYDFFMIICSIEKQNGVWVLQPVGSLDAWKDQVRPGQIVTPVNERDVSAITNGSPLIVPTSINGATVNTILNNQSNWATYSFNADIPHSQTILDLNSYFQIGVGVETTQQLFIDNLQIAYAPKSRLYRNGKLIYEDYTVEHTDSDVQDLAAPEKVIVSADYVNGNLQLTWTEASDRGTVYTYEVSGVDENGMESLRSEPKTVEFTSGVKEYRIYLNGTLIGTTPDLSYQFDQTITSSDRIEVGVVDHAGNESKTQLNLLNLTAQAKPSDNMIRLDWTNINESTYQVYQKKEGSDEFQTISMTDLSKGKQVRVLNVYPLINLYDEPYTTWDGEFVPSQPKSAVLKEWMEKPNAEDSKGYGKGLIKVHPITFDQFNQDPMSYLKDANGDWAYDVVMFGSADANADADLNQKSYLATKEFLDSGRGVLFGHDTLTQWWGMKYLPMLSSYANITTYPFKGYTNDTIRPNDVWTMPWSGGTQVELVREGLFNTHPWKIGEIGDILTIPYTHTNSQVAKGDVWLKFTNPHPTSDVPIDYNEYNDNGAGTNMAYLTTWNNAAMIQTGHSINRVNATPDEQKILANTLFYLNQLSDSNYLNDYSGQDVKGPETPSIKSTQSTTDGFVELTFNPFVDQGSTYEYYVKASPKDGESNAISPIVSETITTGVAGVSYVIDTHPKTEPDNQLDVLTNNKLKVKLSETQTSYVHLKVIDQAGNSSETLHIPISKPPVLRSEVIDNTYVRLDWATEILPENLIWSIDYELNEQPYINLVYDERNGMGTGGQFFDNQHAFSGSYSLYSPVTVPDKGNWVYANGLEPSDNNHVYYEGNPVVFNNGEKISISYRLRTSGETTVRILPQWQYEKKLRNYNATLIEDAKKGSKVIKISDPSVLKYDSVISFDDTDEDVTHMHRVRAINHETKEVTLSTSLKKNVSSGTTLKYRRTPWAFSNNSKLTKGNGEWQLVNINTAVNNSAYINWSDYETTLRSAIISDAEVWFDELRIGYATAVALYRDGVKIYEGYDSQLDDLDAIDRAVPDPIDLKSLQLEVNSSKAGTYTFNLQFEKPNDNGSTYQYQITAVNKYGAESLKSKPISETVTSGIKGYSYLIDTHPTTDPDTIIDLAADQRQISYTGSGTHYLHIKVIDEAGNASETQHVKLAGLELTAQAKPSENMIRLDWTDLNESTYQVYQKKEGATKFQSISMTDLSKSQQVQVLNVYPTTCWELSDGCLWNGTIPLDSEFTTWDGETLQLPKSARLKRWMEEPNTEHLKGYGQGIIEVTPISIQEFNQNPSNYLKNADGTWKYDVIMFGTWDANGNNDDISNAARTVLIDFIESNRGILFGHDTLRGEIDAGLLSPNLASLASYVNLRLNKINYDEAVWHRSEFVEVSKKGLLTNYPWDIGGVGTVLTIPQSHTVDQVPNGDVWLKFNKTSAPDELNYYLTTWNNAAMIQTGHSNGEATPDEQKILANTLFYLNQLSVENYLDDHSGQDVKAPAKPSVSKAELLPNGFIELQFNELIDRGSTYEYYVKATHKSGYEQISNTVKETITTGVAGVSYVIDTHPNTEPDDQVDAFDINTIQIKPNPSQTTYLHLKVIDQAGNSSETLHFSLAFINLTAEPRPTENNGKGSVHLEWTDLSDYNYQIFKKEEESEEFQKISTTETPCLD